jgi:hypothetical protein
MQSASPSAAGPPPKSVRKAAQEAVEQAKRANEPAVTKRNERAKARADEDFQQALLVYGEIFPRQT